MVGGGDHRAGKQHECKVCRKSFPCGRSLGGHMRSHLSSTSAAAGSPEAHKMPPLAHSRSSAVSSAGYGLRENPKKTWRLSDPPEAAATAIADDEKLCSKSEEEEECEEIEDQEQELEEEDGSKEAQTDDDEIVIPRKKQRSRRVASITCSNSSAAPEFDEEQEDVALTLMMLSRDSNTAGFWNSSNSVAESSDGSSVIFENKESELQTAQKSRTFKNPNRSEDQYSSEEDDEPRKNMMNSNFCASSVNGDSSKLAKKRGRYECGLCRKNFPTYQAFGGHRASHMRMAKDCAGMKVAGAGAKNGGDHKAKEHQCPICFKVFSSGQALGGHKRSHVLSSSGANGGRGLAPVIELDLNLPAPVIAGNGALFSSCWIGIKPEQEPPPVGLISNS